MTNEFDIAIVGMSCRLPGAQNIDEFWSNLAGGVETIRRLSDEEILSSGVPHSYINNPSYVKAAALLEEPGDFDAYFFGFSRMEARTMDPQHRILLELAHEALENAGYDPEREQRPIGVFTGAAMNTYFMNAGLSGRFSSEYIPTLIGNDKDFLSTRISYKLNLKGPSITVQTACSTSMVAVHLARQSLLSGETDMALAGAISVRFPHRAGYFCDGGGVVSSDGHVRAFDARANGTVFGSGGGILVLKRLVDAIADRDTIHAVIKGSAVNNDGADKAGYTAPSVNSQADAVVEALANAGVEADSISYIEAHGSGTPVGDPIEVRALTKAFRTFTDRSAYCAIGSVKTNVGHLDAAAAVTGIIKTVLALKHHQIPPSLHFSKANPEIDFPSTPFFVNSQLREWTGIGPRRAGVMSTGMGGTNAHVILEEAPERTETRCSIQPCLLMLSAKTETALGASANRLQEFLAQKDSANMSDVAYTLRIGRKVFPYRRFLVCADRKEAVDGLRQVDSQPCVFTESDNSRRSIIFLLPGIGDHYVGMAHELYETQTLFRRAVDQCADIVRSNIGVDIRDLIYPKGKSWKRDDGTKGIDLKKMLGRKTDEFDEECSKTLNQTQFAQPALFTIEYAMARLWQSLGINPDAIIGHSMGEYVAACLAQVLSLEDALRLITTRAKLVSELSPGAMLAVMLPEAELLPLMSEDLSISLINGPSLCVVAGPVATVAKFEKELNARNILSRRIRNGHGFHSRMLDPIVKTFETAVSRVRLNEPTIPYISNVTGHWITSHEATSPSYWAMHATHTARFSDALRNLWQLNNPVLLEVGPGRTLTALALQHPARTADAKAVTITSIRHDYEGKSDIEVLLDSVGKLWLSGVPIKWEGLYAGEQAQRIPLPTYPFERQHCWLEPVSISDAPSSGSIHKNPNPSEWLYVQSWKRLLPKRANIQDLTSHMDQTKKWLIFADQCGLSTVLINKLTSAGHEVITVRMGNEFRQLDRRRFTISPSNPKDFDRLIDRLLASAQVPDHIVLAWNITLERTAQWNVEEFAAAQRLGFYSLLFLTKALAADGAGRECKLIALSNGAQDVNGTETLCPEKSTLFGPCIVIRQEYPNILTKNIDIDISEHTADYESAAEFVLGEFVNFDSNLFIAYRNAQRWVQVYEPVRVDNQMACCSSFRQGGVYLITGGLGEVGVQIAEYLAENYQARIVLVGRTNLPNRESWSSLRDSEDDNGLVGARIRTLERIEELGGEVLYLSANVADSNGMEAVLQQVYQHFSVLHGVFHGAGIVGDYLEIKESSFESCDRHFKAKAIGLNVMEEVLDGKPLDFCLLISSLASVLGGLGQAAYASANIYMDAFARRHNRSSCVPWLSVNWDVWRGHDHVGTKTGIGTTLKDLGMTAEEATKVMDGLLTMKNVSHLIVSTGDLGARINQWINLESLTEPRPATRRAIESTISFGDKTEQRIAEIWRDALGVEEIGLHDNFAQLGGHSLLAIRIVAEMRKAFQIDLPVRALFDSPTVTKLATDVKDRILTKIEALTDEEAEHLLRMTAGSDDDLVAERDQFSSSVLTNSSSEIRNN